MTVLDTVFVEDTVAESVFVTEGEGVLVLVSDAEAEVLPDSVTDSVSLALTEADGLFDGECDTLRDLLAVLESDAVLEGVPLVLADSLTESVTLGESDGLEECVGVDVLVLLVVRELDAVRVGVLL